MKEWVEVLLDDIFWSSVIVFLTQLIFIYLRTINVIYTSERRLIPAIISGLGIGMSWLVSMSIGAHSFIKGDIVPIMLFLLGGAIGTYFGIIQDKKNKLKKENLVDRDVFKEIDDLKNLVNKKENNPVELKNTEQVNKNTENIDFLKSKIGFRKVVKKLPGWKNEHEFIEFYARVYVLDNGTRKKNPPYIAMDSNGVIDDYNKDFGPKTKLKCMLVSRLVIPGYFKEDEYWDLYNDPSSLSFKYAFKKSHSELADLMYEYNYERVTEDIYKINFYEI